MFCNAPALAVHTAQDTAAAWATGSAGSFKAQSLRENCYIWSRGELASLLCPSWPCSPCLPDHPRRNWPQDPLHHSQVLAVVMCLREKRKGKACNRFQLFNLHPWVFPCSEPLAGQHLGHLYKTAGMEGTPVSPRGSWLYWATASILFHQL